MEQGAFGGLERELIQKTYLKVYDYYFDISRDYKILHLWKGDPRKSLIQPRGLNVYLSQTLDLVLYFI